MKANTAIGIGCAFFGLLMGAMMDGTQVPAFFNIPALLIVCVGTAGVTLAGTSMAQFKQIPKLYKLSFSPPELNALERVRLLVNFAEMARREGLLALESDVDQVEDPFIKRGLQMVIDGLEPETVEEVLEIEIEATHTRHMKGIQMLAGMGGYSPTLGVLGTVVGLVNVLGNLSDPNGLGESIATAFIATLLGVGMANVVWLPLSQNLKARDAAETAERRMALVAILSIQAGDNPRIVAQKLQSFASPAEVRAASTAEPEGAAPAATAEAA